MNNINGQKYLTETYSSEADGRGTPAKVQYDSPSSGVGLPSAKHCSSMRYPTACFTVALLTFTTGITVVKYTSYQY